ncbi:four helix bundle protein [Robertkochia marina]|uniref:Four helix bundle protein n=1 Tax=Robertkochia marina TaxID=1227945 RepID=A0A4S3M084_9FLAO|nr:four helix bundle protein [Robertkochia marina]THD67741.1 four helix bundle protein [Robertkochia marina]TRZ40968.1 four helix bundle protein [Robertkochia marina]
MGALEHKSFEFSIKIVELCRKLRNEHREFILSKQILRSGTAIGSLYREAQQAESKADFIHKLAISQKECNETKYWIDFLSKTNYLDENTTADLSAHITELSKLLSSIILTTKKRYLK